MIRKTIIVVLTLGAVGIGVGWLGSGSSSVRLWPLSVSPARFALDLSEGHVYLFVMSRSHANVGDAPSSVRRRKAESRYRVTPPLPWEQYDVALGRSLSVPLWPVLLFMLIYPTIAFIRGPLRRWRRHRKGLCLKCGYDLTGNTTGVCSECGEAVDRA